MTSLKIREFSEAIRKFVNENSLPTEAKRLALKEIEREIEIKANAEIMSELGEQDRKEKGNAESV